MSSGAPVRGGSSCSAATNASRKLDRDTATAAGSARSAHTIASGSGSSHGTSERTSGCSGSSLGATIEDGSGRRPRPASAVRQALVAIRYSQVRSEARSLSNRPEARQARSRVSCTRSSASCTEPSIR